MMKSALVLLLVGLGAPAVQAARPDQPNLVFLTGTLGVGDCGGTLCDPSEADTGPSLGFGLGLYLRPVPYFAVGLDFHYNLMTADDVASDRVDEDARYLLFGVALRAILPLETAEPWLGLGAGYGNFGYFWSNDARDEDLTVDGPTLWLGLGVDFKVATDVAIGGVAQVAFPSWAERCRRRIEADRVITECRDVDSLDRDDRAELPDNLWYVGLTLRFEFL